MGSSVESEGDICSRAKECDYARQCPTAHYPAGLARGVWYTRAVQAVYYASPWNRSHGYLWILDLVGVYGLQLCAARL